MSSLSSAPPPQAAHNRAALTAALVAVVERCFFAFAEPAAPGYVIPAASGWYEASVSFGGPLSGSVILALPVGLARELWTLFLGLESDAVADAVAVQDLTGELTNMVCGAWLTGLAETSCFELTHPEVRRIEAAPAAELVVVVNDQPIVIVLQIASGDR
jgi:hypothetical protein